MTKYTVLGPASQSGVGGGGQGPQGEGLARIVVDLLVLSSSMAVSTLVADIPVPPA